MSESILCMLVGEKVQKFEMLHWPCGKLVPSRYFGLSFTEFLESTAISLTAIFSDL